MDAAMAASSNHERTTILIAAPRIDLCLDFVNTLCWRGSAPEESLHDFADLLDWCAKAGVIAKRDASGYRALAKSDPAAAAKMFLDAIAIREAIYRIVYFTTSRKSASETDLGLLNDALKNTPLRVAVEQAGGGFGWRAERMNSSAAAMLTPVLWSAADLLVSPNLARVQHCANDRCLWLFLDESKNRTRRWCSMQSCGNRAKAHRHYLRQSEQM
jgi:predicted RNA-binding Zn ribbon-like protein